MPHRNCEGLWGSCHRGTNARQRDGLLKELVARGYIVINGDGKYMARIAPPGWGEQ